MEDTAPESRRLVRHILNSLPVERRLLLCAQMYEDAREFARIGMPDGLSKAEQEAYIFRRIHGRSPIDLVKGCESI
jgi:hypothetical protein